MGRQSNRRHQRYRLSIGDLALITIWERNDQHYGAGSSNWTSRDCRRRLGEIELEGTLVKWWFVNHELRRHGTTWRQEVHDDKNLVHHHRA